MTELRALDAYRLPELEALEAPERFDKLEVVLEKAAEDGVIAPLPGSEEEQGARGKDLQESRVRTIRTRLYLLGYLKRDNESPEIDDKLKEAIQSFQADAGLKADRWVGPKTWTALQELVSFEHPSNVGEWFEDGRLRPAALRAVKLRLFVLGLLDSKQCRDEARLEQGLARFVLLADLLKLHAEPLSPTLELATIQVLFDQDRISERLGEAGETFLSHRPEHIRERDAKRAVRRFVICCAKVELWLLGYEVPLDGKARLKSPPKSCHHAHWPARYPLFHALYTFWKDNGQRRKEARRSAADVTGILFRTLQEAQEEGGSISDPGYSERLYAELINEDAGTMGEIWGQIKAIGSRIWDGIKRVWRWFKSLFRKAVRRVTTWAKNVARLAYRYALNAFPRIRQILKITKETASFLLHKVLPESDPNHIVIRRDRDCDYLVYVNPGRSSERVERVLSRFGERARRFSFGVRILGLLVSTLIAVMKRVALGAGWFGLILALVKIYSRLRELEVLLDQLLDEEQALLAVV